MIIKLILSVMFLFGTSVAAYGKPMNDSEYERLAPDFVVEDSTVRFSELMTEFLGRFKKEYSFQFSESDAAIVKTHAQNWFQTELDIINETNAYNYTQLHNFDVFSAEKPRPDIVQEYAETIERLNDLHEERLTSSHKRMIASLSEAGTDRLNQILEDEVKGSIAYQLRSGSKSKRRFDWVNFVKQHPMAMARQLHIEAKERLKDGPPTELVMKDSVVSVDPEMGARLHAIQLVPKSGE